MHKQFVLFVIFFQEKPTCGAIHVKFYEQGPTKGDMEENQEPISRIE